jgi:peptidoglycan/xylan/chitin deacetylase (PgdA/CDA1 family)
MRQAAAGLLRAAGAFAVFRLANRQKILILTYHRFSIDDVEEMTPASVFAGQLEYVRSHYTIVPLSAVERHLTQGGRLPYLPAAITIDDGYRDAYDVAFPILRRYGVPATLFAVTDFVDRKGWLWTDKLRFVALQTKATRLTARIGGAVIDAALNGPASRQAAATRINLALKSEPDHTKEQVIARISTEAGVAMPVLPPAECSAAGWRELREMADSGVEIGSHTVTHPILLRVDGDRLAHELTASKRRLEAMLGREVTSFCYPNGDTNSIVRTAVEQAGYRLAVTTEAGLNDKETDPLSLRRIHTERDPVRFAQSTCGFEQLKERIRGRSPSMSH